MNSKEIAYSTEAREKMMKGIDKLANAVKVTLGPKGRNVIIDKLYSGPRSTKDGVTVARDIFLKDPFENIGAQLVKQVSLKTSEIAGDGTTTATVLAQSLMREGIKALSSGINPMDLKRGIDIAISAVIADLKVHSKPIALKDEIYQISKISANGDDEIAAIITRAFDKVGKHGMISISETNRPRTELEIVNGILINNGYLEPLFVNKENLTCEYEDAHILFYEQRLSTREGMEPILGYAYGNLKTPLLIVADDVLGEALSMQINNVIQKRYHSCSIKAPSYHHYRMEILDDMCILTGGNLVPISSGDQLKNNIKKEIFGRAGKIIISKDKTLILDGKGDPELISKRKILLENKLKELDSNYNIDKEYRQHIYNRLQNFAGVAVIYVGGTTDVEMKERYDRYDDSLNATRAALEEGILPGGGIALFKSAQILNNLSNDNSDIDAGIKIVKRALSAPLLQIAYNAGKTGVENNLNNTDYNFGYDAQKDIYIDMIDQGIVDPTKVVRCALEDAASVAGILITTESIITNDEEISKPALPSLPSF